MSHFVFKPSGLSFPGPGGVATRIPLDPGRDRFSGIRARLACSEVRVKVGIEMGHIFYKSIHNITHHDLVTLPNVTKADFLAIFLSKFIVPDR